MAGAGVGERMRRQEEPGGQEEPLAAAEIQASAAADPDVALMLRFQGGDEFAFRELFQKFGPRILHYARRLVGSEARAEELTQDVFVQMYRFRHRYRPESRLATWVYKIATNVCLNELRRPERRLRIDLWGRSERDERPEGPSLPDPDAPTAEPGASTRELSKQLESAVAALPPKQRAALLLSRVDGLAYRDVARSLGCTEGAVKALLFRATQTLKRQLREYL